MSGSDKHSHLMSFIQEPETDHIIFEEEIPDEDDGVVYTVEKKLKESKSTISTPSQNIIFQSNEIASARLGVQKEKNEYYPEDYQCQAILAVDQAGNIQAHSEKKSFVEKNQDSPESQNKQVKMDDYSNTVSKNVSHSKEEVIQEFPSDFSEKGKPELDELLRNELENEQRKDKESSIPVKEAVDGQDKSLVFLEGGIGIEEEKPRVYSLQEEFEKKRKNKSWLFYFVILIFMGTLAFATYFLTEDIQRRARLLKIDFTEFADLNLSDLIDTARKAEERINKLRNELEYSKLALADAIKKIRSDADQEIALLDTKNLTKSQKKAEIQRIRANMEAKIAALKKRYQNEIALKEGEINQARVQKEAYDKKLKAQMADYEDKLKSKMGEYERKIQLDRDKTKDLISEKDRVYELEMNKLRESYEKQISELRAQNEGVDKTVQEKLQARIKTLETQYQEQATGLQKKLNESIAFSTASGEKLKELEAAQKELQSNLIYFKKLTEQYRYAFSYFSSKTREHGYILDPRDEKNMIGELSSFYDIKSGTAAVIINDENKKVADVKLYPEKEQVRIELIKKMDGAEIQPFDKIVVEFQ